MATQLKVEDDDLELDIRDNVLVDDDPHDDDDATDDDDDEEGEGGEDQDAGDDDEYQIVVGDIEARAEDEPEGVRNLREALKETKRRLKEAESRLAPATDDVGEKPNIDDYWDNPEQYDIDRDAWADRKRKADEARRQQEEAAERFQKRWQEQERQFEEGWGALPMKGKDTARAKVEDQFDTMQRAMLVKAARGNAAALFYVLGSDQARIDKLKALADDPAEFIAEAAVLAKETQVQKRKPTTAPETRHTGQSGGGGGRGDSKLERLEREAEKTGDRTELLAYRRKLRERETSRE